MTPPPPPTQKKDTPVITYIFTHHNALTATDDTSVQQHYTVSLNAHPVKIELRIVRRRAEKKNTINKYATYLKVGIFFCRPKQITNWNNIIQQAGIYVM